MVERPSDLDIADYIGYLEAALADGGGGVPVRLRPLRAVRPWVAEVLAEAGEQG